MLVRLDFLKSWIADIEPRLCRVSKIEAARRQIEAAIWLWFVDSDIVSVHTLASAAHRLLCELASLWGVNAWPSSEAYLPKREQREIFPATDAVQFFRNAKTKETYEVSGATVDGVVSFRRGDRRWTTPNVIERASMPTRCRSGSMDAGGHRQRSTGTGTSSGNACSRRPRRRRRGRRHTVAAPGGRCGGIGCRSPTGWTVMFPARCGRLRPTLRFRGA